MVLKCDKPDLCRLSNVLCMARDRTQVEMMSVGTEKRVIRCPKGPSGCARMVRHRGITGRLRRDQRPPPSLQYVVPRSPIPVVRRDGSSPTQPSKGGGRGRGSPLTRAFASSKPLPIPPPSPVYLRGLDPWRGGARQTHKQDRQPRPSPSHTYIRPWTPHIL